jgi:glycosyltransferase involved in cell wall biosynthesis
LGFRNSLLISLKTYAKGPPDRMSTPLVTVAVLTYNRSRLLRETLAGMVRQNYPSGSWELIVVDNNSTDDTKDAVASFHLEAQAPRLVVETRQGLDHGRNRAIEEARGEVLVLADDDILVGPDWLAQLVAPFASDSAHRIGVVGGEVVPVFPDGVPAWLAGAHRPLAFRREPGPLPPGQAPMGANFAFPRWVFERLGRFDTDLDRQGASLFGGGDSEMIRRVRAAGLEAWFAPGARALHQMTAERLTFGYAMRHAFDSARSRVVDAAQVIRESGRSPWAFLASRSLGSLAKLMGYGLLAIGSAIAFQGGASKRALVRAWRSCGYLYQIARTARGKI